MAFVAALLGAAVPRPAGAQSESVVLRYRAAGGCPIEADFVREVRARTSAARFAEPAPGMRTFSVRLELRGAGASGELEILEAGGAPAAQQIEGESCQEVASALALLVALSLDPAARAAPAPGAPPARIDPPPAQPAPDARAVSPFTVGVQASAAANVAPRLLMGASVFVGVEPRARASSVWVASGRAGLGARDSRLTQTPGDGAQFRWLVGELEGCPLTLLLGASWVARPCATFELGQLAAQARAGSVAHPGTGSRLWLSAGVRGRLQWQASERLVLEGNAGAAAPLGTYTFVFEQPHVEVHHVPWVGAFVGLGAGYHFL